MLNKNLFGFKEMTQEATYTKIFLVTSLSSHLMVVKRIKEVAYQIQWAR